MTAAELLRDLERRDVRLALRGDRLKVDAPQGVITDELQQDLKACKPELITLIRERESTPAEGSEIATMSLREFALAGIVAQVHSNVLGCEVLFVSDNVPEAALEGTDLPIYRAAELHNLAILRPPPHTLQVVHDVKTIFDGVITDVRERDDHDQS